MLANLSSLESRLLTVTEPSATNIPGLSRLLAVIRQHNWPFAIFGGYLRDLHLFGENTKPRDVDIVIQGPDTEQIGYLISSLGGSPHTNVYGGLKATLCGTVFDIWPIEVTWAFRERIVSQSLTNLPKTTFLNFDAVAAVFSNASVQVVESGYLRAVQDRTLRINLREHPIPVTAIAKTLTTVLRFGYALDADLLNYITQEIDLVGIDAIQAEHRRHYGFGVFELEHLRKWLVEIQRADAAGVKRLQLA